jgi:hypothetical protein
MNDDSEKPATKADLERFVIERENALLKWVITVQLAFFAIQVTTLLTFSGAILGGVYYILIHFKP